MSLFLHSLCVYLTFWIYIILLLYFNKTSRKGFFYFFILTHYLSWQKIFTIILFFPEFLSALFQIHFWVETLLSHTPHSIYCHFPALFFLVKKMLFNWQKLWHKESEGCRLNWLFAQSCVSARCSTPRGNNVKQITRSNAGELLSLASFINLFLSQSNWLFPPSLSPGFYFKAEYAFVS